eukprot:scaffold412_cov388-Prasinococcus_capsulatus_cf.AAC.16
MAGIVAEPLTRAEAGHVTIELSQLLQWYGGDFGDGEVEVLRRIVAYMGETEDRKTIEECLATEPPLKNATVSPSRLIRVPMWQRRECHCGLHTDNVQEVQLGTQHEVAAVPQRVPAFG